MISKDFLAGEGVGASVAVDSFPEVRLLTELLASLIPNRIIAPRMIPKMMAYRTSLRIAPRLYTPAAVISYKFLVIVCGIIYSWKLHILGTHVLN